MNVAYPNGRVLPRLGQRSPRVTMPDPGLLARVCAAFLEDPGSSDSIDAWAARFATTRRTLARAFRRELDTTFARWRSDVRVALAIERLAAGATVTLVAFDLGYASHSAFTAMFRRATGRLPSDVAARRDVSALEAPGCVASRPTAREEPAIASLAARR